MDRLSLFLSRRLGDVEKIRILFYPILRLEAFPFPVSGFQGRVGVARKVSGQAEVSRRRHVHRLRGQAGWPLALIGLFCRTGLPLARWVQSKVN